MQTIPSWFTYCTGLEVSLDEATGTFVDVLWCRSQGEDAKAQEILEKVQYEVLNREVRISIYAKIINLLLFMNACGMPRSACHPRSTHSCAMRIQM